MHNNSSRQIKVIDKSGTSTKPIVLKGSRNAILNGNSTLTGRCIHFFNSNHWILDGFTLTNGLQAIMLDNSSNNLINNVYVHHTGIDLIQLIIVFRIQLFHLQVDLIRAEEKVCGLHI